MFRSDAETVTDTRSLVWDEGRVTNGFPTGKLIVRNTGTNEVWLGGPDVTSANGFRLDANEIFAVSAVGLRDELWAVCSAGESSSLRFLWTAPA